MTFCNGTRILLVIHCINVLPAWRGGDWRGNSGSLLTSSFLVLIWGGFCSTTTWEAGDYGKVFENNYFTNKAFLFVYTGLNPSVLQNDCQACYQLSFYYTTVFPFWSLIIPLFLFQIQICSNSFQRSYCHFQTVWIV